MAQKSKFKAQDYGDYQMRKAFPQWPYSKVENPKFITTPTGSKLLVDGWWAYARKPVSECSFTVSTKWFL